MPIYGYYMFQITGVLLAFFFLTTAISSPMFRQPDLMKYHLKAGRITIVIGLLHMFFALSALFFGFFI